MFCVLLLKLIICRKIANNILTKSLSKKEEKCVNNLPVLTHLLKKIKGIIIEKNRRIDYVSKNFERYNDRITYGNKP